MAEKASEVQSSINNALEEDIEEIDEVRANVSVMSANLTYFLGQIPLVPAFSGTKGDRSTA